MIWIKCLRLTLAKTASLNFIVSNPENSTLYMRRKVLAWSLIGLCVPIFWGVMSFVMFTMPQSIWSDAFWYAVYVTCPFWLLPTMPWWLDEMLMLVLNALLYGAIAYVVLSLRRGMRSWSNRSSPL